MTKPDREQLLRDVETAEASMFADEFTFSPAVYRLAAFAREQLAEAKNGRAICEALGFDPTNHHNAAKCPYCTPQLTETPDAVDDGEPITDWPDPWLRRSGFEVSEDDERDLLFINTPVIGGFDILATSSGSWELSDGDNTLEIPRPKTRGDVRNLCKALGVELKGN